MTINKKAPVNQQDSIFINADAVKVWSVLASIVDWPDWNDKIHSVYIDEPVREGNTFQWRTNGSHIKSTIHTYHINQALGWSGHTFGAKAIHNWYLQPAEHGTKIFVEESMEGWLVSLFKNKLSRILEKDMNYWLVQLKNQCEKVEP